MNLPTKQMDGSGRLHEYVIGSARQMIADGELQAGQKLPSEREPAEKFDISRVPIRKALKIPEYMGVLNSSPGDDTYMKNTSAQSLVSKIDFSFGATADVIRDLLELCIVLEIFAAYHVVQRRTDEDVASTQKSPRDMREAKKVNGGTEESVQNLRKPSHSFHQALIRAVHSAVLPSVYEYLCKLLDISQQFTINNSDISHGPITVHEALLSKVIEGGAERVRQCMEGHVEDVHYNLRFVVGTDCSGQKTAISRARSKHE